VSASSDWLSITWSHLEKQESGWSGKGEGGGGGDERNTSGRGKDRCDDGDRRDRRGDSEELDNDTYRPGGPIFRRKNPDAVLASDPCHSLPLFQISLRRAAIP
jgi:hypothetical protein